MNVTFPDNATIQILVVPHGASVPMMTSAHTPVLLEPPVQRASRRRDIVFLCFGACLCVGILAVVQSQHASTSLAVERAHAARVSNSIDPAAAASPAIPSIPQRTAASAPPPSDYPTEAVRRLLAQPPTITPPPGAVPSAPAAAAPSAFGSPRNAFGMSD